MKFLYPADPCDPRTCDETFACEYASMAAAGYSVHLFSYDLFVDEDKFKVCPAFSADDVVVYRGWMLTIDQYADLAYLLEKRGVSLRTSFRAYQLCHHLPRWYPLLQEYTSETGVLSNNELLVAIHWDKVFVKDFVKSLGPDSIAETVEEVEAIVRKLEERRGFIEGGVCIREYEEYLPGTEKRYFVLRGKAYDSEGGTVPDIVMKAARIIASPFFSVDVAERADGVLRIVELGDGQVSDLKQWTPEMFVMMFLDRDRKL